MATIQEFGPFRLDQPLILFRGTEPVALGKRAVALLRLLLEQGRRSPKNADRGGLAQAIVEESNLTVQIAALRRILEDVPGGAGWIETLPRRGYRYVGPEVATGDGPGGKRAEARARMAGKPSVAALPFSNLSGDPEQEYFTDGMVEDIIAGLSRIKGLFVVARNSSFTYTGRART